MPEAVPTPATPANGSRLHHPTGPGGCGPIPRPLRRPEPVLLRRGAAGGRPNRDRLVGGAPLRQAPGLQALREELQRRRRRRRRGVPPGGSGHLRTAGGVQHRAAGGPGRGEARPQHKRRRRRAPPLELPLRHHPPCRPRRLRHRRRRVLRRRCPRRQHQGGHLRLHRHHRPVQPPVPRTDRREFVCSSPSLN